MTVLVACPIFPKLRHEDDSQRTFSRFCKKSVKAQLSLLAGIVVFRREINALPDGKILTGAS
ncbi:hypothetical protein N7I30_10055 [Aurantimonas litoralis]|nr:hypothetical protein [Aurantimonas litoralis]